MNLSLNSLGGMDSLYTSNLHIRIDHNDALKDIDGLDCFSVMGGFYIGYNDGLKKLLGLDSIKTINNSLWIIGNDSLENLTGLSNLDSIGGTLRFNGNNVLRNIDHLSNLIYVGGEIYITVNDSLSSLIGIENVESEYIDSIKITSNGSLSDCDVKIVCEYLENPIGTISIGYNSFGCKSIEEVEESCETVSIEMHSITSLTMKPNPFSTSTTIEYNLNSPQTVTITFYNQFGKQVDVIEESLQNDLIKAVWTPENLTSGIYYLRLEAGEQIMSRKMLYMK